jgi:hypothetical protein
MAMVIELSELAAARVSAAAAARGVTEAEIIEQLAATLTAEPPATPRRPLALAGVGATEHGITTRIADGFGQD